MGGWATNSSSFYSWWVGCVSFSSWVGGWVVYLVVELSEELEGRGDRVCIGSSSSSSFRRSDVQGQFIGNADERLAFLEGLERHHATDPVRLDLGHGLGVEVGGWVGWDGMNGWMGGWMNGCAPLCLEWMGGI